VVLPDEFATEIAQLCRDAGVDGHRADIATARAARALAALAGRPTVTDGDIRQAASLALGHRMRSTPFEDAPDAEDVIDDHFENADEEPEADDADSSDGDGGAGESTSGDCDGGPSDPTDEANADHSEEDDAENPKTGDAESDIDPAQAPSSAGKPDGEETDPEANPAGSDASNSGSEEATPLVPGQSIDPIDRASAPEINVPDTEAGSGTGRADAAPTTRSGGARVRTEPADSGGSIDAAASVRAAATRGRDRVETRDLRQSVRSDAGEALVVFAVDASASMRGPMRTAKGVAIDLLQDAYEQRDEVALVAFAGDDAEVLLPPTDSVTLAARHLKELPTGDRTPLPAGMQAAGEVVERADPDVGIVVLVTDGRPNTAEGSPTAKTRQAAKRLASQDAHVVVVDAGRDGDRSALTGDIAAITDGEHVPLSSLSPERVEQAVAAAREETQR
jgi:magnesium chelatase subunit D